MSHANKLENTYLNILRYVILTVATISLFALLIMGFMALKPLFSSPPEKPKQVKFENQINDLKKEFTLEKFKNENPPQPGEKPQNQLQEQTTTPLVTPEDPFTVFIRTSTEKIADNVITYVKTVKNIDLNREFLQRYILEYPINSKLKDDKTSITFYFETLISLSGELARQSPEIAKLSEDKKIEPAKLLSWHFNRVNEAIKAVDESNAKREAEFKEKEDAYLIEKASIFKYATFAGYAFSIFLCLIMLFVMVKIERNLRPIQQIADNGKDKGIVG